MKYSKENFLSPNNNEARTVHTFTRLLSFHFMNEENLMMRNFNKTAQESEGSSTLNTSDIRHAKNKFKF